MRVKRLLPPTDGHRLMKTFNRKQMLHRLVTEGVHNQNIMFLYVEFWFIKASLCSSCRLVGSQFCNDSVVFNISQLQYAPGEWALKQFAELLFELATCLFHGSLLDCQHHSLLSCCFTNGHKMHQTPWQKSLRTLFPKSHIVL